MPLIDGIPPMNHATNVTGSAIEVHSGFCVKHPCEVARTVRICPVCLRILRSNLKSPIISTLPLPLLRGRFPATQILPTRVPDDSRHGKESTEWARLRGNRSGGLHRACFSNGDPNRQAWLRHWHERAAMDRAATQSR